MSKAALTTPAVEQDLNSIREGEWPDREFPLGPRERPTRRQVIIRQSVLNEIHNHGRSAPDIEVCGVMVGNVYQDAMGPFVYVEACIRGNFAAGRAAQVTFTAKTWQHIQDVLDKDYPELRILGWYHTHPGHGIFLSDMDLFIHKNFFSLPWHVAFVFDPKAGEEGLFAWRSGNMAVESFVVKKDVPQDAEPVAKLVGDAAAIMAATAPAPPPLPGTSALAHATMSGMSGLPPQALHEISNRLQSLEKQQRWVTAGLALLAMIAVAWPLLLAAYSVLHGSDDALQNGAPPAVSTDSAAPPGSGATASRDDVRSLARTAGGERD
jgi:proteasome lid subunit RPN8/RPN11